MASPTITTAPHATRQPASADAGRTILLERFEQVRAFTCRLCEPLAIEDYVIQSMPDVSPAKWHLAHTTWFFERFILQNPSFNPGYQPYAPTYDYLFNSYYNTVGPMHCRPKRGLLSRPTVAQVYAYRDRVNQQIGRCINQVDAQTYQEVLPILILGLHHEQQHQELLLTDIKHVFSSNPLLPAYHESSHPIATSRAAQSEPCPIGWQTFAGGVYDIGCNAHEVEFCFDNETPRHKCYLEPFALASRLVTNQEYLAFIEDGGYDKPELWLSMGWATIHEQGWRNPIYWYQSPQTHRESEGRWMHYTLAGSEPVASDEPVCHLSYFEADAFARWAGCRLPTEAEWEVAAAGVPVEGNFADQGRFHPSSLCGQTRQVAALNVKSEISNLKLEQMFGDVWEWTSSQYSAYPGYQPLAGALGEYNGKFMCNQFVLRGGSCATSKSHIRPTYRNFFPPDARWQFTGLRLARNA